MAPAHLPAGAPTTQAAVTDAHNKAEADADPPLLRRLLQPPDGHGPPSIGGTAVTASVLLLPASPDFMRFQGRVLLRGGGGSQSLALPLALRCGAPGGPVLLDSLRGDPNFQRLWAAVVGPGHQARLGSAVVCRDVGSFAAELSAVLEEAVGRRLREEVQTQQKQGQQQEAVASSIHSSSSNSMRAGAYVALLRELQALGWAYVEDLQHQDVPIVTLRHLDAQGRPHTLRLTLAPQHPHAPPLAVGARLPGGAAFEVQPTTVAEDEEEGVGVTRVRKGGGKTWGLRGVLRQFAARVAEFQPFWEVMDDLDSHALCLGDGQERKDRGTVTRRLVLPAQHASLVVKIDPGDPRGVCDARFIGPESVTRPLQEKVYRNLALWDAAKLPRENLEALLELQFPSPRPQPLSGIKQEDMGDQNVRGECAVCYAYRLTGHEQDQEGSTTPTVACDNPQCGRLYHPKCLLGWLATLPGTQTLGGGGGSRGLMMGVGVGMTMLGSCPYCTQPIALDVPVGTGVGVGVE